MLLDGEGRHRVRFLSQNKFYSFLMDGSTNAGKVEQELVVLLSCKKMTQLGK